jgi:hypothetical protein
MRKYLKGRGQSLTEVLVPEFAWEIEEKYKNPTASIFKVQNMAYKQVHDTCLLLVAQLTFDSED